MQRTHKHLPWLTQRSLALLVHAMALVTLVALAALIVLRLPQPFALELLEEGVATMSVQVLEQGLCALYAAPGPDYVPLLYGPLFPVIGALSFHLVAAELFMLRLFSVLALCATLLLLTRLATPDTGTRPATPPLPGRWLAAALFAATYGQSAHWFDLARVDMVALALALAGIRAGIRNRNVLAGILLGLSLLTKQTALPITIAFCLGLGIVRWRSALTVAASFLVAGILPFVWFHICSDGLSTFYLWTMPGLHPIEPALLQEVVAHQWPLAPLAVAAALGAICLGRRGRASLPLLFALLGALAIGLLARIRVGGSDNVLMPAHAAMVVLAVICLCTLAPRWPRTMLLLVLAQLLLLLPGFRHALPSDGAEHGRRLSELLRTIDEPVFAPTRPFLLWQVGKGQQADGTAVWDVLRSSDESLAGPLRHQMITRLQDGSQRALLVSSPTYREVVGAFYPRELPAFPDGATLGVRSFDGIEQMFWMLRADDDDLAERIQASWR